MLLRRVDFIEEIGMRVTCLGKESIKVVGSFDHQIETVRVMSNENQESNGIFNDCVM